MKGNSILTPVHNFLNHYFRSNNSKRVDLHTYWLHPERLPSFVRASPVAIRYLDLLGPLDWSNLPERNLERDWGQVVIPNHAFLAAYLIKLEEQRDSMGDLLQFLQENPALIWLCGFPLTVSKRHEFGFDPRASLPTERHMARMLRRTPNATMQYLLENSVQLLISHYATLNIQIGECISLDTKHIIAWVKENNPKAYIEEARYDKTRQPPGDPDCKLGCKRKHNKRIAQPQSSVAPKTNGIPAEFMEVGEYYWGYGSGVVVAKVPDYGEFILAEMTQTFDHADVSYFFPLMTKTEQILGFKPRFGTFDAAFDAWYVYDYFHRADDPDAFAAVPFSEKGGYKAKGRQFSSAGLPICAAGLEMPLQFTYTDQTISIIPHERGKYVCPLRYPQKTEQTCPINHQNWKKRGCTSAMPISIGARLRYTLDRESQNYKDIYKQRTAVERINSQAVAMGIERPHLRNGAAITNLNTLIYILINLRLFHRLTQNR